MMRVLITGSCGFIGTALATAIRSLGLDVREMDLQASGSQRGDITSAQDCREFCDSVDVIVHGAAIHHAVQVRERPDEVARVNVGGTDTLLSAAQDAGVRRFVYLSTAKIYGEPSRLPSIESDALVPLDAYATAKLAVERRCQAFHRSTGIELAILRPFSVYGVGQDLDTGYVGMLLAALRDRVDPVLPGAADYLRDFVYIDDLVRLTTACVTDPLDGPTTLNVGSGRSCSLSELVQAMSELLGYEIGVRYREAPADTIARSSGDISAAAQRFGSTQRIQLREGLQKSIDWALGGGRALQIGGQSR